MLYIFNHNKKNKGKKKESCIKIPYNLEYRNEEEDAHVREKVEEESVVLLTEESLRN